MSSSKKPKKCKLDNKVENVSAPWQAWYHSVKQRKFYTNSVTKESIWDHPNTLKAEESPAKPNRESRKRKDLEANKSDSGDVEKMEVDVPPPPKRKTVEDEVEGPFKRMRRSSSVEVIKECQSPRKSTPSNKILPHVPWSTEIRPFNKLYYQACAIFDTCALIEDPQVLDTSVEKLLLTVIPYAVLSELDGLKNSETTRRAASAVSTRLKSLQEQKNIYLHVETSVEQQIRIDGYLPNSSIKDDSILNCALRIKKEVLSISNALKLDEHAVFLVTNDTVLSNKALTHELRIESIETFFDRVYGRKKNLTKKSNYGDARPRSLPPDNSARPERSKTTTTEKSYKKAVAVGYVKKQRETRDWIKGMVKPYADQYANCAAETTSKKPGRSRPSIPLEDELVSCVPKITNPIMSYCSPQTKISTEPNRNRPRMPLSLSDDESGIDEMDCS